MTTDGHYHVYYRVYMRISEWICGLTDSPFSCAKICWWKPSFINIDEYLFFIEKLHHFYSILLSKNNISSSIARERYFFNSHIQVIFYNSLNQMKFKINLIILLNVWLNLFYFKYIFLLLDSFYNLIFYYLQVLKLLLKFYSLTL